MQQLLIETAYQAQKRFDGIPLRIWYVMLSERAWRTIIINTASKVKLAEGPIRASARASVQALKTQLEAAVRTGS